MKEEFLCHQGIIKSIDKDKIVVTFVRNSACSACHSKNSCMMTDSKEEEITITDANSALYQVGELINITMEKSLGGRAIIIAYLLPFIVLVGGLLITFFTTQREILSILVAFAAMTIYYIAIKLLKNRWEGAFQFKISKVEE